MVHAEAKLSLYRDAGDRRLTANAGVTLGIVLELQGRRKDALKRYRDSWDEFRALEATGPDVAFAACGTGRMLVAMGQPAEAFEGLREALTFYDASDRKDAKLSSARCNGALALAHLGTGDRQAGLDLAREAYPVLLANGDVDSEDLRERLRQALGLPAPSAPTPPS